MSVAEQDAEFPALATRRKYFHGSSQENAIDAEVFVGGFIVLIVVNVIPSFDI